MKKNTESFPAGKYDTSEISRRLYRGALDSARRLEEFLRGSPRPDMLGSEVTSLRMRLKDYCERLLFSDSSEFSRKAEELMWRKVYYEPLQLHKQHRKQKTGNSPAVEGEDLLCGWLRSGVGHYHHLLWRLQTEFQLSGETNVNLAPPCLWKQRGLRKERWGRHHRSACVRGREDWATQTAHRCLLCLGDLARYLCECGDPCAAFLSESYYRQAFLLTPSLGMPFNQMGTLVAMGPDSGCHALYFYLRCLLSPQSFEGAEGNIQRVFEKNQSLYDAITTSNAQDINSQSPVVQKLLPRFLKLSEHFFNQQEENLPPLCQEVLQDLDKFLTLPFPKQQEGSTLVGEEEEGDQGLLTFRMGLVAVMSFTRLKIQGSPLVPASAAFALSLLSQVVRHCLGRLQMGLLLAPDVPPSNSQETLDEDEQPVIEQDTLWPPKALEDGSRTRSTSGTLTPIVTINGTSQEECNGKLSAYEPDNLEPKSDQSWSSSLFRRKKRSSLLGHLSRRRRRNISCTSQDDSEVSNEEGDFNESDLDNGISSDISETGSVHGGSDGSLTEQEEEEDEKENFPIKNTTNDRETLENEELSGDHSEELINGHLESDDFLLNEEDPKTSPQRNLSCWETLEVLIREDHMLALIKVFTDWLTGHPDILTACIQSLHTSLQSTRSLWKHFADLLNALLKAEATLLETPEPLRSILLSLRCPRPSASDTTSKDSLDSLNNKKNNSDLVANAVSILSWKWPVLLPEDAELQLLPIFSTPSTSNNNKNGKVKGQLNEKSDTFASNSRIPGNMGVYEQLFGRLQCLIHFGLVLSIPKLQEMSQNNHHSKNGYGKSQHVSQFLHFSPEENLFVVVEPGNENQSKKSEMTQNHENNQNNCNGNDSNNQDTNEDLEDQRKQLMRNMAHLWLKAEVRDLEVRTGSGRGARNGGGRWQSGRHNQYPSKGGQQGALQEGCLPPYLVPDAGALCHQLPALKQLQAARCFILILPASVISSLDELKRQSAFAREAIRWIEAELRAGSRFLRAQKSQERLSLVPMKYPKRKEKESWDFFQVLECCHYLNHSQGQGRAASGSPLATLVTGGNQFLPPNAAAIASSAGVSMESVEDFLNKWRNSFKS